MWFSYSASYRWNPSMIYSCTKLQKHPPDKSILFDLIWPLTSAVCMICVVDCILHELAQLPVIWKRLCIPILIFLGTCTWIFTFLNICFHTYSWLSLICLRHFGAFVTLSSQLCFVVEDDHSVVGFVAAAANAKELQRQIRVAWLPEMQSKYPELFQCNSVEEAANIPTPLKVNRVSKCIFDFVLSWSSLFT